MTGIGAVFQRQLRKSVQNSSQPLVFADPMTELEIGTNPQPEPTGMIDTAGGAIPRARATPSLTHGGITTRQYVAIHIVGAAFPLAAGLVFYGWRALISVLLVLGSAAAATAAWRRIGLRGEQLSFSHGLWLALLLALTMPAHLAADTCLVGGQAVVGWPLLPAAAIVLIIMVWAGGGIGSGRIHPVVLAHLLVVAVAAEVLVPHAVLQKKHAFFGDILNAGDAMHPQRIKGPWNSAPTISGQDAVRSESASQLLTTYTSGIQRPAGSFLTLEALLRDHMPPLEDLIIGGVPGPIGTSSVIAVIIGGLFLMYRGVIDYRIPLLIFLAAFLTLLVLPIPVEIRETARQWHWLAIRYHDVTPAVAITFVNYELMASPLIFVAFFLATEPTVRPMARRARAIYAILIGILAATLQLYCSVRAGPYIALLMVGLLTPILDRLFVPRTLV
jgi:Na+-translocating ferredoxin:NAD+ oxidoreductase RnfD subunit